MNTQQEQEKKKIKKITFEQLVARKTQREKEKLKTKMIYIPCLDAGMIFRKIPDNAVLEILDEIEVHKKSSVINAYKKLIYLCCEDLQSPELQRQIGSQDPYDTVDLLFSMKDIMIIGEELLELLDLGETTEKIKN